MTHRARPPRCATDVWTAFFLCAFAYLYVVPLFPAINNPNENVRFDMTAAIVEYRTYAIDALRARWGWVNDAAIRDGHVYSVKAPGASFLGVPGYALYFAWTKLRSQPLVREQALWFCRLFGTIAPLLLWLACFYRWLRARAEHAVSARTVFLSVALGSCLYGYALLFVSHAQSAAAAFGSFMLLYDARRQAKTTYVRAGSAGFLAAAVTLFEYPGLLASLVLSLYALFCIRPRRVLSGFALGALLPTLAMMHFQWRAFGSPFTPGHHYLETPEFRSLSRAGFFGSTGFSLEALWTLLFEPGVGLFAMTPVLLLAFYGFVKLLARPKERLDAACAVLLVLSTTFAICTMNNWRGGWTVGPRYLALCVPFVAWGALVGLDAVLSRARVAGLAIAASTVAASLVLAGSVSVYYPHVPPEIRRPVAELVRILVTHGYAPLNALNLAGVYGSASMVPMALVAVVALRWMLASQRLAWVRGLQAVAVAFLLFLLFMLPEVSFVRGVPASPEAVAFVTRMWHPSGHDRASWLQEKIASGHASRGSLHALARLYDAQGRFSEAQNARNQAFLVAP